MLVCFAQNIPNMLLVLVCQDVDRGLYHQLVSCSNVPILNAAGQDTFMKSTHPKGFCA